MEKLLEEIKELITPTLVEEKVELYSITYEKVNGDMVLSILLDSDSGVDLEKCIEVSDKISVLLDKKDPIKEEYMLEVASAGLERPITNVDQFIKNIDKYVLIQTNEPVETYDELVGYLREVRSDSIILEIKIKTRVKKVEIAMDNIYFASTYAEI